MQFLHAAEVEGFFADAFQCLRKFDPAQGFAAVKSPVTNVDDAFRDFDIGQRGTFIEGVLSCFQQEAIVCKIHLS